MVFYSSYRPEYNTPAGEEAANYIKTIGGLGVQLFSIYKLIDNSIKENQGYFTRSRQVNQNEVNNIEHFRHLLQRAIQVNQQAQYHTQEPFERQLCQQREQYLYQLSQIKDQIVQLEQQRQYSNDKYTKVQVGEQMKQLIQRALPLVQQLEQQSQSVYGQRPFHSQGLFNPISPFQSQGLYNQTNPFHGMQGQFNQFSPFHGHQGLLGQVSPLLGQRGINNNIMFFQ